MSASKFQYNYLKLPLPAPDVSQGFTAVILTYDRVDMLYQVMRGVAKAPSLAKVLVLCVLDMHICCVFNFHIYINHLILMCCVYLFHIYINHLILL